MLKKTSSDDSAEEEAGEIVYALATSDFLLYLVDVSVVEDRAVGFTPTNQEILVDFLGEDAVAVLFEDCSEGTPPFITNVSIGCVRNNIDDALAGCQVEAGGSGKGKTRRLSLWSDICALPLALYRNRSMLPF